jgi:hypothetical protein
MNNGMNIENNALVIAAEQAMYAFEAASIACAVARRAYYASDDASSPAAYAAVTAAEVAACEAYRVYQDAEAAVIADRNK